MKEELEEGHFDGDGHFRWNKTSEIKDHWLDNLDWVKIKKLDEKTKKNLGIGDESKEGGGGLADSSSDSETDEIDDVRKFDVIAAYRRILELMEPKETIKRTLQRLGKKSANISSIERFRRKKAGIIDENATLVIELTELTNKILTKLGNMDIYEETYEHINEKFASKLKSSGGAGSSGTSKSIGNDDGALDMYADDFDTKEQEKIVDVTTKPSEASDIGVEQKEATAATNANQIQWQFKWKKDDNDSHGPFSTEQMQQWVDDGYFKDGVFVKKIGTDQQFYSSNRVDFELYL